MTVRVPKSWRGQGALLGLWAWTGFACGADPLGFENIRIEQITATSAVILFDTSRPTTCEIQYGPSEAELTEVAVDPNMDPANPYATAHRVPLSGLTPLATYYYRPRAIDRAGNVFTGPLGSFTTPSDQTPDNAVLVSDLSGGATVADVSSNFGGGANDSSWGANRAFDGDFGTAWATHGDGDDAWVTIDLGQTRSLTLFRFQSREMTDGSSIISELELFRVEGTQETSLGTFEVPSPKEIYTFQFAPPVSASKIRLQAVQTTGGNTGANEIQFFESQ